jgi:hypothetical protein
MAPVNKDQAFWPLDIQVSALDVSWQEVLRVQLLSVQSVFG